METIDWYMDRARERAGLPSDRQLGIALGLNPAAVSFWRQKKTWPDDGSMVRLAEIAGVDVSIALVDLNTWRAKTPHARSAYSRLADQLARAAPGAAFIVAILAGILAAPGADARNATGTDSHFTVPDLYIMRKMEP